MKTVGRVEIKRRWLKGHKTWNDGKQGCKIRAKPVSAMIELH